MSNHTLPVFVDIQSLGEALEKEVGKTKLTKAIRLALLYQSCHADLRIAADGLRALLQLIPSPRKIGTPERMATETALLMQSVILFVRATTGKGGMGQRGSINIVSKLDSGLQSAHKLILNVRNRALAHVYHGEKFGERIWSEQAILLMEKGDSFHPMATTRTAQVDQEVINSLGRLLPAATEIVSNGSRDYLNKVVESLNQQRIELSDMDAHKVDPTLFFGSPERVIKVAASADSGVATFISN